MTTKVCANCKHSYIPNDWLEGPVDERYCHHPLSRQTTYAENEIEGRHFVLDIDTTCRVMRRTHCKNAVLWRPTLFGSVSGWIKAAIV